MPRSRAWPSCALMESNVHLDIKDESGWEIMICRKSVAIGCGDDDYFGEVLAGLTLMARLADPPAVSSMCIRSITTNLEYAKILVAEKDWIMMAICINRSDLYPRPVPHYLIYNASDASLAITPDVHVSNPGYKVWEEAMPLPLPFHSLDGGYSLVHIATSRAALRRKSSCPDVLFLWPPPPPPPFQSSEPSSSSKAATWVIKEPNFLEPAPREIGFSIQRAFSFQDKSFWADLAKGIIYCRQSDLLSGQKAVQFQFIDLPPGLRCEPDISFDVSAAAFRTIGCVGGTIKLVSISGHLGKEAIADCKVSVWTLMEDKSTWKEEFSPLCIKDLWKQHTFKKAGLSTSMRPKLPLLSPHEDGIIYLVLPDYNVGEDGFIRCREQHMLRVDMRQNLLISSSAIPSSDHLNMLQILGFDFCPYLPPEEEEEEEVTDVLKKKLRRNGNDRAVGQQMEG